MRFTKMHGAGNDYVYVDCFAQPIPADVAGLARRISDRRTGVGSDGLILICPSDRADAEMRMYNADGSYSEMCGNGIRCVAKYVFDHGIKRSDTLRIETAGKVLALELQHANGHVDRVRVDMGEPILLPAQIPTTLRSAGPDEAIVDQPLTIGDRTFNVTCVSMGNPHCVAFVEKATDDWVLGVGPRVEVDSHFPKRTNVEFVELLSRTKMRQRTWERGSGETYACGTGACAVCVSGILTGRTDRNVMIHLLGGDLEVEWSASDNHVYKTGPAVEVFSGEWNE
jgi:diaminopimelate epimerase